MLRIISTQVNNVLVSALTEDFSIKEFVISPKGSVKFQIGDIVIGRIRNIVRNISSIFVEFSPGIEGYLNYNDKTEFFYTNGKEGGKPVVNDTILVQIAKEPTKTKSYTLVTDFTLISKYVVLKPGIRKIHLSSKFRSLEGYKNMKEHFTQIGKDFSSETGAGFIVRRAALELEKEEFKNHLVSLYSTYEALLHRGRHGVLYERIYKDLSPHLRLFRDCPDKIEKIMSDDKETYLEYESYLKMNHPSSIPNLVFYEDEKMSLNSLYSISTNLQKALQPKVWLQSGAYIVIERTEALIVIDVNSGKAIAGKSSKDDTFLKINLEAAKEIARQIRLRNLCGIILVDFIDIPEKDNKRLISAMEEYLKTDSTTASVVGMTKLGLMEITRRRSGKPLHEYRELQFKI